MSNILIYAVVSLSVLGALLALILYFVAQKFKVIEDPKIDEVEEALPAANCGGCGFAGCRNFAEALVEKAKEEKTIEGLNCPVGGSEVMNTVAGILGLEAAEIEPMDEGARHHGVHGGASRRPGPATDERDRTEDRQHEGEAHEKQRKGPCDWHAVLGADESGRPHDHEQERRDPKDRRLAAFDGNRGNGGTHGWTGPRAI